MRKGYLVLAGCWMGLLFFLSSLPDTSPLAPDLPLGLDKLAHASLYGVLGFLLGRGLGRSLPASAGAAVAAAVYGLTDEWHQAHVPGRNPSAWDWAADAAGALVGAAASRGAFRSRERSDG